MRWDIVSWDVISGIGSGYHLVAVTQQVGDRAACSPSVEGLELSSTDYIVANHSAS